MENILFKKEGHIATITLNRPKALNAFSSTMLMELAEIFEDANKDSDIYCVILNSACEKAFTAGGDVKEENQMDAEAAYNFAVLGKRAMKAISSFHCPVITAVHGYCLGGGMEIILASDITIAAKSSKIGIPTINLGGIPGWGATQMLPRLVGASRAKDILITGRTLDADECLRLNIIEYVAENDELMIKAKELAEIIADKPPIAAQSMKEAIDKGMNMDFESGLKLDNEIYAKCYNTEDHSEAMAAFLEKRPHKEYKNK